MVGAAKIFCIGLNKTGTTSLHLALGMLGYRGIHYRGPEGDIKDLIWANHLAGRPLLSGLAHYDAFSDWNHPHTNHLFKVLDREYPGSRFILTMRDLEDWLASREDHVRRAPDRLEMARQRPWSTWWAIDKEAWRREWNEHHEAVRSHFQARPSDLLVMNIPEGQGWERLCPFLGRPIPSAPFPRANPKA